jgi:DNA topoisomerase-2
VWTEKVEAQLKNPKSKLEFTKVEENHTDVTVQFTVKGIKDMDKMIKALKLEKNVRENYVVFSEGHLITTTVASIIDTHYEKRLRLYHSRVDAQLKTLLREMESMEGKLNFIEACINGKIPLTTATYDELIAVCATLGVDSAHLDMKLRDLTKQNVVKLKQSIQEARDRYEVLRNTPVTDIWLKELQELKRSIGTGNKKRIFVDITV